MRTLIKGAEVISDGKRNFKDILIDGEKIIEVGNIKAKETDITYDARGLYAIPGGIDPHTHFQMDLSETLSTTDDFISGSRAAVCGGTTTVIDFAEVPKGTPLIKGIEEWNKKTFKRSYSDYAYHMTIVEFNEKTTDEMKEVLKNGVTSFKVYMAYKDIMQLDDEGIYRVLKTAKDLNVRISFHCENGDLIEARTKELLQADKKEAKYHWTSRPNIVEKEAVSRILDIAKLIGVKIYIVHLSTAEALEAVKSARLEGVDVVVETCSQYLLLDKSYYENNEEGVKYILSPPLRGAKDIAAMWKGIADEDIQVVATDHCSFSLKNKNIGIGDFSKVPNGILGVEERIKLLYTYGVCEGKITLEKMVDVISTNPAKIFGIYPKKGSLSVGSDADILLLNPMKKTKISAKNHSSSCDYNPYEDYEIKCEIANVFLRGVVVAKNNNLVIKDCTGEFLYRG